MAIERIGTTSIGWRYRLHRAGEPEPAAEARLVTVNLEMESQEKRELPEWLRERLEGFHA